MSVCCSSKLSIQLQLSGAEKYPAKQHAQRVASELGLSHGLIYLLGQYAFALEDSDMPKTWRQRRYFHYMSGVDVANCCLLYDIAEQSLVLYIPVIHPERILWEGRPPTIEEAEDQYDVDYVGHNEELFDDIRDWEKKNPKSTLYILHNDHKPKIDISIEVDSKVLQPAMDRCRVIKDEYEVARIRKANDISASAHRAILRNVRYFTQESEIHGKFVDVCISHGQAKQAYSTITGSGENASVLHYSDNNESLKGRLNVCIDAGAEWENYASDVTRTFPLSGQWTEESEEIYKIVETMQESCIQMLKPGAKMIDLHRHCHRTVARELLKLGILHNATEDELVQAGTTKGFYPHGLGHNVGLDVHDVIKGLPILRYSTDYNTLFQTAGVNLLDDKQPELEEGMVVTIEPGCYFNRYELHRAYLSDPVHSKYINKDVLQRYWAVGGVRIEDCLLITADGYENLTTAPKGQEMLDLIRSGNRE